MAKLKKTLCAIGLVVASVTSLYVYDDNGNVIGVAVPDAPVSKLGNPLRVSPKALDMIAKSEGCRQDSYYCPAGKLTVGIGSTKKVEYRLYSLDEIALRFATDLMDAQNCVEQKIELKTGKQLPQPVFDMAIDMVFNFGCTKFINYPITTHLLNEEYSQACNRTRLYVTANGNRLPGLVERREKFADYCLTYQK